MTYTSYTIVPANLTGVTIAANLPSPQMAGDADSLTATAQGGSAVGSVDINSSRSTGYPVAPGAPNILLRDWSTTPSCVWTPTMAQNYALVIYARPVGSTTPYVVTNYLAYTICRTT